MFVRVRVRVRVRVLHALNVKERARAISFV